MPSFAHRFDAHSLKLVIFDLDGTFVNTVSAHVIAWERA